MRDLKKKIWTESYWMLQAFENHNSLLLLYAKIYVIISVMSSKFILSITMSGLHAFPKELVSFNFQ